MMNPREGQGRTETVIKSDLIEDFHYFIKGVTKINDDFSKIKQKDFSIITLMKLLSAIQYCDMTFAELYRASNIAMKRSYLNYLDLCKHFGFVENVKTDHASIFHISEKGKILLSLFKNAEAKT